MLFPTDFIHSVASSLDEFDTSIFRPDGDINFERDFGQWFNPDDVGVLEMK
jgi:collagen type III alpha